MNMKRVPSTHTKNMVAICHKNMPFYKNETFNSNFQCNLLLVYSYDIYFFIGILKIGKEMYMAKSKKTVLNVAMKIVYGLRHYLPPHQSND